MFWFSPPLFFFTHFLNKIRYLLFVWKLVYRGTALYLQDISFTVDVTFWRPKEADRKKESVSVVNTAYPDILFMNISHAELTFRQNFGSNTLTPLSSTQFQYIHSTALDTVLTSSSYSISPTCYGRKSHRWLWMVECLRDFQISLSVQETHFASLASMANATGDVTQNTQKAGANEMGRQMLWAPQGSLM